MSESSNDSTVRNPSAAYSLASKEAAVRDIIGELDLTDRAYALFA